MTTRNPDGWYRLLNPVVTQCPPVAGSGPEVVLASPTLVVNDNWMESVNTHCVLALAHADGSGRTKIRLAVPSVAKPDTLVFLAFPNRLWLRTLTGERPAIGDWLADPPWAAIAAAESRGGKVYTS